MEALPANGGAQQQVNVLIRLFAQFMARARDVRFTPKSGHHSTPVERLHTSLGHHPSDVPEFG